VVCNNLQSMPKFCDECGTTLPQEQVKFCPECGKNFFQSNNKMKTLPINKEHQKSHFWAIFDPVTDGVLEVFIGLLCIIGVFSYPVISIEKTVFTLAQINSLCSNPTLNFLASGPCSTYNIMFYGGLVIGGFLIIVGLLEAHSGYQR